MMIMWKEIKKETGKSTIYHYCYSNRSLYTSSIPSFKQAARVHILKCIQKLRVSWKFSKKLTRRKPFPPLARLSPKSLGCRHISSLLFCWYSLSNVIAAKPFPTEPVIRDTTPAAPPIRRPREVKSYGFFKKH